MVFSGALKTLKPLQAKGLVAAFVAKCIIPQVWLVAPNYRRPQNGHPQDAKTIKNKWFQDLHKSANAEVTCLIAYYASRRLDA